MIKSLLATSACGLALSAFVAVGSELPSTHRLSATPMVCRVDTGTTIRAIPRGLLGTNLEWFNNANGISTPTGSVDPQWISLAQELGAESIRFPGGVLADFYHWRDGIGPESARPTRLHPTDDGSSANNFGTPEFLRFASSVGARPLITVNAGTGDAAEAAAWVAYCNQPDNAARRADGLSQPLPVKLWEIGNELYLSGNPSDKTIITVAPEVYANRFLEFAHAMRAVDPSIKLLAIGTANSSTVPLPYPDWSEVVLAQAGAEMDYYAVHNAYFPMIFGQTGLSVRSVYQSLWAAPESINRSLTDLDSLIARYEKSRRIEIAVTEWGSLFSYDKEWVDHTKTIGSAVYLARVMQVFLGQPRVTLANFFKFTDRSFMGCIGYDGRPKVPYYVLQLFNLHFGTQLIAAGIDSPTFNVPALGVMAAESNVPELTVVASRSDDGNKLYVNIVNRSWSTIHQVKLDLGGYPANDNSTLWSISSDGVTDSNGPDIAPEIPASMYQEPESSVNMQPIKIQQRSVNLQRPFLIPPFSIATVEVSRR